MPKHFKDITPYDARLVFFKNSEIVSRINKAKASILSPKAMECQRQINEASSVWAVDGKKFLFIFAEVKNEGLQKVSVWGLKSPGEYQHIKTIWVTCHDYIFEAIPIFLCDFFELSVLNQTYITDRMMFCAIEKEMTDLLSSKPLNLKNKMTLLKEWCEIMPRFDKMVAELDLRGIDHIMDENMMRKPRMKTFLQDKGATYNISANFTVAVRKEFIEYYLKIKKRHAVANIEIFNGYVRVTIACNLFGSQLSNIKLDFDCEAHPKFTQLLNDYRYFYNIIQIDDKEETRITINFPKSFSNWIEAIADKEFRKQINEIIYFFFDIFEELSASPSPDLKPLSRNFYD